jgi:predicted dinucleotide-binding enzyme
MRIAFIGYGGMAQALASKWQHKHDLFFSGRDLDKAKGVATSLGAESGTPEQATAFGEVIVLATPADSVFQAIDSAGGAGAFSGKVVIDINNPIDVQSFVSTLENRESLTEQLAQALPKSSLAKAFNMSQITVWADQDMSYDGRTLVTMYTADTEQTAQTMAELIRDVGADPLHIGGTEHAYQLEAAAALVIKQLFYGCDSHTVLNLIQPEVKAIR